jgi:hypothetical protein
MKGEIFMAALSRMNEPFAFWLVQSFLIPEEDQADEMEPLTSKYTFVTGTVVFVVIVIVRLLLSA